MPAEPLERFPNLRRFRAGDGAELAYVTSGAGAPAIVFVHGWQGDHSVWDGVIDALGSDVLTVAVDQRGSGASRAAGGPVRLERLASDLRELIDELEIAPAVIVGHSMGATLALRFAVDAPHATRAIVLVAPVPASGGGFSERREAYLRATAGDPERVREWLARTLADPADERTLDRLCATAALTPREAALESFESWAFADFADATRRLEVPALVIAPERDAPEAAEQRVSALLPNARNVVIPGAAHYAIVEQPREIARLIRDFVA